MTGKNIFLKFLTYLFNVGAHCISKITPAGVVSLFAGSVSSSSGFVEGTGSSARFNAPYAGDTRSGINVFGYNGYISDVRIYNSVILASDAAILASNN